MNRAGKTVRSGFTLIELTVVISVIVLAMAISLPTMVSMFKSGADKQAVNVFSSMCVAARTAAIRDAKYTCLHCQVGTGKSTGLCYLAIFTRDAGGTGDLTFRMTQGFEPQRLPGDMCLGAVSAYAVTGGNYNQSVVDDPTKFACFNIIFSPSGRVVSLVNDQPIQFNANDLAFNNINGSDANIPPQLWDFSQANGQAGNASVCVGVAAVTLFPYGQYIARPTGGGQSDPATRTGYINANGQFLPLNYYTGQLYPRR